MVLLSKYREIFQKKVQKNVSKIWFRVFAIWFFCKIYADGMPPNGCFRCEPKLGFSCWVICVFVHGCKFQWLAQSFSEQLPWKVVFWWSQTRTLWCHLFFRLLHFRRSHIAELYSKSCLFLEPNIVASNISPLTYFVVCSIKSIFTWLNFQVYQ